MLPQLPEPEPDFLCSPPQTGGLLLLTGFIFVVVWCFTSLALPFLIAGLVFAAGGIWIMIQPIPGLLGLISGLLLVGSLTFDWGARVNWLTAGIFALAVLCSYTAEELGL